MGILDWHDTVEFVNPVVGEENPLESWAIVEALNGFNEVSSEVDFGQGDQSIKPLNMGNEVISQIENSKFTQMAYVFNLGNFIWM